VKEHTIQLDVNVNGGERNIIVSCTKLNRTKITTSMSSLMFLAGFWAKVKDSIVQPAFPQIVKGQEIACKGF
jgi:hypothetical protein